MKLDLDFVLYKGKTRLKDWWKEVESHFTSVQEAHNDLEDTVAAEKTKLSTEIAQRKNKDAELNARIDGEVTARTNADSALQSSMDSEAAARASADNVLDSKITAERNARATADNTLDDKITAERNARTTAYNTLSGRVAVVEGKAHTHGNKSVLDGITALDVEKWNGIKEQVTQTQLDAVASYLEEICFGFAEELDKLYTSIGITHYDGGIFGMPQDGAELDGGALDGEVLTALDCGGFEPYIISAEVNAVMDGGVY